MSSIMDLNALGIMELGASSRIRVRVPNRSRMNQFSCFINPNIKMPPNYQNQPLIITRTSLQSSNACLPSRFHRDRALKIRARATSKDDDTGESSGETIHSDLRANMSPLDPNYIEYGLIYYTVLVRCCALSSSVSKDGRSFLRRIIEEFSISDGQAVKQQTTDDDYDFKKKTYDYGRAVDHFLKHKYRSHLLIQLDSNRTTVGCISYETNVVKALMFVEVIRIVKFHLLDNLTYKISNLVREDLSFKSKSRGIADSKTLVAKSAVGLSKEMHKIFEVHTKLMEKFKLADAARNYLNLEEEDLIVGLWLTIHLKCQSSVNESLDYILDLFNSLKRFNDMLMRFCECKCVISREYMGHRQLTQIDDFENIQENLRLANLRFDELILIPHTRRRYSMRFISMTDMAVGFEHSLIAYRSMSRMIQYGKIPYKLLV